MALNTNALIYKGRLKGVELMPDLNVFEASYFFCLALTFLIRKLDGARVLRVSVLLLSQDVKYARCFRVDPAFQLQLNIFIGKGGTGKVHLLWAQQTLMLARLDTLFLT